jgi:hypothetical protein
MAKDLPYFKFYCSEWSDGDINLEDMSIQGLFINICAYYWSNECNLTLTKCKKKFKLVSDKDFDTLIESNIIKIDNNDNLIINFLNEQLQERNNKSVTNTENGLKGGRPRKNKPNKNQEETEQKPNGYFLESETKPKQKAIREEEIREDDIRKDNNKKDLESRKTDFYNQIANFVNDYSKNDLRDFFEYWSEHNENGKKMKFEMQKTFDVSLRLKTWLRNKPNFQKPQNENNLTNAILKINSVPNPYE